MENDKHIDRVADEWLKKMSLDDPSENFSRNVMQSVFTLSRESAKKDDNINYWWFLLLIPVFAAAGWYLSTIHGYAEKFSLIWTSIQSYYFSLNSGFGEFFSRVKGISISPVIILVFLAILSLLVIEDIFSKSRQKLNAE